MIVCDRCGCPASHNLAGVAAIVRNTPPSLSGVYGGKPEDRIAYGQQNVSEQAVDLCPGCYDRLVKLVNDHLTEKLPIAVKR